MVFFVRGRLLADANKAASIENRFYGVYGDSSKLDLTKANLTEQQKTYKFNWQHGYFPSPIN
tara:strand:+ start:315 stop:500 length:186 start_codon:yes stop_codon:yes gene_type:complete